MPWRILAFAVGVFILQQFAVLPAPIFIGAGALGGGMLWLAGQGRRRFFAWCAAALLGFAWAGFRGHLRLADALPPEQEGREVEVVGRVDGLPQRFERGVRFVFEVEQAAAPVPERLLLSWYRQTDPVADDESGEEVAPPGMLPLPHGGERWRLVVRLKRPHGSVNPHGFDYEGWLFERGIRATGYVKKSIASERLSVSQGIDGWRERIRLRIYRALDGHAYAGVVAALAVGDQQAIAPELWRLFAATGITHLMSISGLHVTMFGALAAWLVSLGWRRSARLCLRWPAQKAAALAAFGGAFGYALLAGFGVPAQRTLYMLGVAVAALLSGRSMAVSQVLGAALLLVLLLDPWAVLSAGFWLSFVAVALLFFVARPEASSRQWLQAWGRAQWAITLGLIPLLLALFQQFSLVSPLANAIAIPVISFAVTPLALFGCLPGMAVLLRLSHAVLTPLLDGLVWLAAWPGALWQQHAPPDWAVPLAMCGVFWLLLPRGFPARWLGIVLLLPLFLVWPVRPARETVAVRVLDVGQGLAVHVQTATHDLLYDTGPDYGGGADAGGRVVVPYLRALGVGRLDALVVSHADRDHAGGLESVVAAVPVDVLSGSLQKSALAIRRCMAGESWEWDGVRFVFLHPQAGDYALLRSTNAMSCVLKIESPHGAVLLPGDLEGAAERELLARDEAVLRSEVVIAPHHGGRRTSSPEFVAATQARHVIFSAGYRNRFGHPWPAVEARYREGGAQLHRTDRTGAVGLHLGPGGIEIEYARQTRRRYWHGVGE